MMRCCICVAYGDDRPGDVVNAGGVPLCFEHNASINEQSRKPVAPRVVTFPLSAEQRLLDGAARAALAAAADSPIETVPPGATLQ